MATFNGTSAIDKANASTGELVGFTGGTVAELQDGIGDTFLGQYGDDDIRGGSGDDTIMAGFGTDKVNGGAGRDTTSYAVHPTFDGEIIRFDVKIDGNGNGETRFHFTNGSNIEDTLTSIESVIGGIGNDTISATGTLDNSLDGNSGNDYIDAGGGNDTLIGGAGSDTLIGGAGVDRIDGGAGDDVVFWDANDDLANVLGGDGYDTLLIENSSAPQSFNLAAQGFEQASVRTTDTSGQSWQLQELVYNASWEIKAANQINDDGSSINHQYDVENIVPWAQAITYSNATAQTTHQSIVNDNGTSQTNWFDPTNIQTWSQANTYYNTLGQTTHQSVLYDDGTSRTTYFDPQNEQPWTSADTFYDQSGQTTLQSVANDSGTTQAQYWDTTNANPWSTVVHYYDAAGTRTLSTGIYDNGDTFSY